MDARVVVTKDENTSEVLFEYTDDGRENWMTIQIFHHVYAHKPFDPNRIWIHVPGRTVPFKVLDKYLEAVTTAVKLAQEVAEAKSVISE